MNLGYDIPRLSFCMARPTVGVGRRDLVLDHFAAVWTMRRRAE